MKALFAPTVAIAIIAAPAFATAHEGHDHAAPSFSPIPLALRAEDKSDQLELLAVLDGAKLTIYVDRYDTNEPVRDARVEVEGAGIKEVATQAGPGVYTLAAPASLSVPGKHALTLSVEAREISDLLSVSLNVPAPANAVANPTSRDEWAVWGLSGALAIAALAMVAMRQRRNRRSHAGSTQ